MGDHPRADAFSHGTRIEPTPPAAAWTSTHSPACTCAQRSTSISAVQPLSITAAARLGVDIVGQLHQPVGGDQPVGRIGARRRQRVGDAIARAKPAPLAHRLDHARRLAAQARGQAERIEARAVIGVDIIEPDRLVPDQHLAGPGSSAPSASRSMTSGPPVLRMIRR